MKNIIMTFKKLNVLKRINKVEKKITFLQKIMLKVFLKKEFKLPTRQLVHKT